MRRLAGQLSLTALAHGTTMLALILAQIVLARTVPLRVFGALAVAQAVVALIETAIITRSGEVALQLIGQYWGRNDGLVHGIARSLRRLDAIYCVLGYAGLAAFSVLVAPIFQIEGLYVAALGLMIPVQIGYGARRSLFVVADNIQGQAVFEIINSTMLLALTAGLTLAFGVWGMIAGSVLAAANKNLLAHWRTRTLWAPAAMAPPAELPPEVRRAMRIGSFHSVLRNLLGNAGANADVLLLSLSGRPELVAIYKVARTLSGIPLRLAAPLWVVLRPRLLAALRDDDHRRFCSLVLRMAALLAVGVAAAIPLIFLFGEPLLRRFYGPAYADALRPLLVLFVGSAVFGAVTGWLPFTLVISSRKSLGSAIIAAQLVAIVAFGALFGMGSAERMAWVVAACNIGVALVAWAALLAGRFRQLDEPAVAEDFAPQPD